MSDLSLLMNDLIERADILVGALLVAALVGLLFQLKAQSRRLGAQSQHMEDLQGAVAAYGQSLIATRSLLERMEGRLSEFTERNLEIQSQFAFNRSFEEASRLVRDGGTVESLVNDCGLSDAEADLMIRLHRREEEKPRQQWRQPAASQIRDQISEKSADPQSHNADAAGLRTRSEDAVASETPLTSEEIRLKESLAAAQSR